MHNEMQAHIKFAMAFLRCRMFLRGDGITLSEGPSGRELWFQGMHCTRPDFKHLNHSTGDCACHSSKCPRFLFVSCSSCHIYHSNTSDVEGSIPAVGALTPTRPSSVWWVSSQRFGERVAEGWPTNLDRNVLQVHTSLNANGIVAGQRFRTSLQVPAYAMICPGFMLIFVWYLASSAFISSSEARASATTEPTNPPPKPSDPKDKLRMATSQGIPVLIHLDREHLIPWLLVQSGTIDHKSI